MAKILDTEGLNRLGADVREMIAGASSSVPTITIALNQVRGQNPLQIQLTNEQYDALAASQVAVVDATAAGVSALISIFKVNEDDTWINFRATFYNWTGDVVSRNEAQAFNIVKSTKIITRYGGNFYPIPTITITADNIDQFTSKITLTSAQRAILDNNFIVKFDASIAGYPATQMYKARWNDNEGSTTFSSAPDGGGHWQYLVVSVDADNEVDLSVRELYDEFDPYIFDEPIAGSGVRMALNAESSIAQATNIVSGSTISGDVIQFINTKVPIRINGALCHYMDENTTTNIVRYFTATMNGALVHLNIIEINTSTWVVTFNQVDVASTKDLTANTCFTLDATAFASLVSTHTATVASPVFTGLSNSYEFVTIKASINSVDYNIKLTRNATNKYSGLFFIEDSSHLYEVTLYYNGTSVYLRCATVY